VIQVSYTNLAKLHDIYLALAFIGLALATGTTAAGSGATVSVVLERLGEAA